MTNKLTLVAVLTATTMLAGAALADQAAKPAEKPAANAEQTAVDHDFGKLSKVAARGYQDVMATRLAIFDGRIVEAKKTIADADKAFDKAKTDDSIFTKAEADLKTPAEMAAAKGMAKGAATSDETKSADAKGAAASDADKTAANTTTTKWLPVDGAISIAEDFTANPTKTKAVADANKSLAAGDRKGAMEKLKLAAVDTDVVLAVVPLQQTLDSVHKAEGLIGDGKYYEASQLLRQVQASTRYDVADMTGVPAPAGSASAKTATTH